MPESPITVSPIHRVSRRRSREARIKRETQRGNPQHRTPNPKQAPRTEIQKARNAPIRHGGFRGAGIRGLRNARVRVGDALSLRPEDVSRLLRCREEDKSRGRMPRDARAGRPRHEGDRVSVIWAWCLGSVWDLGLTFALWRDRISIFVLASAGGVSWTGLAS